MSDHGPTWQRSGYYVTGQPVIDIICDTCDPVVVWPCQVVEKREGMDE